MKNLYLHILKSLLLIAWVNTSQGAGTASFLPLLPDEEIIDKYKASSFIRDTFGFSQLPVVMYDPEDPRKLAFLKHASELITKGVLREMEKEFNTYAPALQSYGKLSQRLREGEIVLPEREILSQKTMVLNFLKQMWILSEKGYEPASSLLASVFFEGLYGMPMDKSLGAAFCQRPATEKIPLFLEAFEKQSKIKSEAEFKAHMTSIKLDPREGDRIFITYPASTTTGLTDKLALLAESTIGKLKEE